MATQGDLLFIGDLPSEITSETVQAVFSAYGTVTECRAIPPKMPGQRGAAILRFSTSEEAKWLVDNVNGSVPQGLQGPVVVKYKEEKGKGTYGGFGSGMAKGAWTPAATPSATTAPDGPIDTVFIGDLPVDIDDTKLNQIFSMYGTITTAKCLPPKPGSSKGAALVQFSTVDEAKWLVENVNGNIPEGLTAAVIVKFKSPPPGSGGKGGGDYGKAGSTAGFDRPAPYFNKGETKGKGPGKGPSSCDISAAIKGGLGKGSGGRMPDENQLVVKGLPWNTTDLHLYQIFAPYGAIPSWGVKAMTDSQGNCDGTGYVDYFDPSSVQKAILAVPGKRLPDGSTLMVRVKQSTKGKQKGKDNGVTDPLQAFIQENQ